MMEEADLKKHFQELMGYPNMKKYAEEVNLMQDSPPACIELSPVAVLAVLSLIQVAIQRPGVADDQFAQIGIAAARELQESLFNQNSEIYKALEFGWNPEAYILTHLKAAGRNLKIETSEVLDT